MSLPVVFAKLTAMVKERHFDWSFLNAVCTASDIPKSASLLLAANFETLSVSLRYENFGESSETGTYFVDGTVTVVVGFVVVTGFVVTAPDEPPDDAVVVFDADVVTFAVVPDAGFFVVEVTALPGTMVVPGANLVVVRTVVDFVGEEAADDDAGTVTVTFSVSVRTTVSVTVTVLPSSSVAVTVSPPGSVTT